MLVGAVGRGSKSVDAEGLCEASSKSSFLMILKSAVDNSHVLSRSRLWLPNVQVASQYAMRLLIMIFQCHSRRWGNVCWKAVLRPLRSCAPTMLVQIGW